MSQDCGDEAEENEVDTIQFAALVDEEVVINYYSSRARFFFCKRGLPSRDISAKSYGAYFKYIVHVHVHTRTVNVCVMLMIS